MYQFYLKISEINEKVHTIFISPETMTSYFYVALNKRNAGQGAVFRVQLSNVSGCQKMVSETICYLSNTTERLNVFVDVNVGVKNHNFKFPLILDKYNIMMVM